MIRNLIFDMGGVVFLQDTDEAFQRFSEAGIDPNAYMGAYGQKDFFLDVETGSITADEFCRSMAAAVGRNSISFSEAQHCWLGFIAGIPKQRLELLQRLRQRFRVYMLSNTNPFIMAFTRSKSFNGQENGIENYFDRLFLSYEMHICKPDPRIYQNALASEKMLPEETIFVDDSKKNIEVATSLGIHTLHIPTNVDWERALMAMINSLDSTSKEYNL